MIKRIIFDLDFTIFNWLDPWSKDFQGFFEANNIELTKEVDEKLEDIFTNYEKNNLYMTSDLISKEIHNAFGVPISPLLMEKYTETRYTCNAELFPNAKETLEYLSSKYEVVALSNWVEEHQEIVLERFGIRKYFKECYYPEKFPMKPHPHSYEKARGEHLPKECMMIGDNVTNDVIAPIACGMNAILFDPFNKHKQVKCNKIKNLIELQEIL